MQPRLLAGPIAASLLFTCSLAAQTTAPARNSGLFEQLIEGLNKTPGCVGVVTAGRMSNGQAAIFAFFENKQAAMKWYYSPVHERAMQLAGMELPPDHKPMAHVPDGVPVMAVASITMGGKPVADGSQIPFSQISIELYSPVAGGLNINGGFSPDAFRAAMEAPATQPAGR